uniref:Uncharacterized protein n=1 Tax=Brassica oleracea var. oleracea TaxID=109376 RepID=A0A0D2ZVK7_BRAOL
MIDEAIEEQEVYDSQEEDDNADDETILHTTGDTGRTLILHRSCLTPPQPDDKWLRTTIFRSTCTIKDRVCSFVIDSGSSRNYSEDACNAACHCLVFSRNALPRSNLLRHCPGRLLPATTRPSMGI